MPNHSHADGQYYVTYSGQSLKNKSDLSFNVFMTMYESGGKKVHIMPLLTDYKSYTKNRIF